MRHLSDKNDATLCRCGVTWLGQTSVVRSTTVTNGPPAVTAEERVLDATSDSIAVYAEHRDVFAFRGVALSNNPGTAVEMFSWHVPSPRWTAQAYSAPPARSTQLAYPSHRRDFSFGCRRQ